MKKILKSWAAVFLALSLTAFPLPGKVYGRSNYSSIEEQLSSEAASSFQTAMKLILHYYIDNGLDPAALYNAAIQGMAELLDEYSEYMTAEQYDSFVGSLFSSYSYFGIIMVLDHDGNIIIENVLAESSAHEQGVLPGDILLSAEGKLVEGMTPAEVSEMLQDYDKAELSLKRGNEIINLTLLRKEIKNTTVTVFDLEELIQEEKADDIAYIKISSVGEDTYHEFRQAVFQTIDQGKNNLILDLRDNTGGYLDAAIDICRILVPEGPIIYRKDSQNTVTVYDSYLKEPFFEDIVVLVNENTASSGEIIASALQDSGHTVIGQNTYGKGVIQNIFSLQNGNMLKITTGEYYRRSGEKLDGIGVIPNITVEVPAYLTAASGLEDIKLVLKHLGFTEDDHKEEALVQMLHFINQIRSYYGYENSDKIDDNSIRAINSCLYEKYKEDNTALQVAYGYYQNKN